MSKGDGKINLSFSPKEIGVAVVAAYLAVTNTVNVGNTSGTQEVVEENTEKVNKKLEEKIDDISVSVEVLASTAGAAAENCVVENNLKNSYFKVHSEYFKLMNMCTPHLLSKKPSANSVESLTEGGGITIPSVMIEGPTPASD